MGRFADWMIDNMIAVTMTFYGIGMVMAVLCYVTGSFWTAGLNVAVAMLHAHHAGLFGDEA